MIKFLGGRFLRFTPAQYTMLHEAAVAHLNGRVLVVTRRRTRTLAALERVGFLRRAQTSLYSIRGQRVMAASLTEAGCRLMNVRVARRGRPARSPQVKLRLIIGGKK